MVPISAEPRFHMVGLAFRHRAQVAERVFEPFFKRKLYPERVLT
jgi:hypothetical protein